VNPRLLVLVVLCLGAAAACAPRARDGAAQRKLVILGFDGMDPDLVEQWMDEGKLPHMRKIAEAGALRRLETTPSPESRAAWSSFATGMNAGKHNVFDALVRDPATYEPAFGVVRYEPPRFLLGWLPIAAPRLTSRRGGTSFWVHAGHGGVRSSVLTVPATSPADDAPEGELLSGATPDVRGALGTYQYFATDLDRVDEGMTPFGGVLKRLVFDGEASRTELIGPANPIVSQQVRERRAQPAPTAAERSAIDALAAGQEVRLPLTIHWNREGRSATIEIGGTSVRLVQGEWSGWIDLDFRVNVFLTIHGMAQLYLIRADEELQLYVSPINWKPDHPQAPMSAPPSLSADLFERVGYYRTLGWGEATWALADGRLDEQAFMDDLFRAFDDRAHLILQRIDARQWDLMVAVIDSTDRVQHMMWRAIDPQHPMYDRNAAAAFGDAIERVYQRADDFVGEVVSRLDPGTPIMIVSAYGFQSFRHAVNLNTWLVEQGFMTLEGEATPNQTLGNLFSEQSVFWETVDWSRTRAYAMGFGQLYLNLRGREGQGVVSPGAEARAVENDLAKRLRAMTDPTTGRPIVDAVHRAADIYTGPFAPGAADLQVGFADGYRVSWETALGAAPPGVIHPNMNRWSGDHSGFDHSAVEGMLISSRPLAGGGARIIDIAPTVLRYFGVPVPADIDGQPLF
jgi:predicted AlkP superfamily phosphohydrolase/phosphomutase